MNSRLAFFPRLLVILVGAILVSTAQADVTTVSFADPTLAGGSAGIREGVVELDNPAGIGGVDVDLSDDSAFLNIPTTVHVNEGESTATFNATAPTLVAANQTVTVFASVSGQAVPAQVAVTVKPIFVKAFNWVDRPSRGARIEVTIRTNAPPAADMALTLGSSTGFLTYPNGNNIVMPAGQTSTVVPVDIEFGADDIEGKVTIDATGVTYTSRTMKVVDVQIVSLVFGAASVVGGQTVTAEMTISNAMTDEFLNIFHSGPFLDAPFFVTFPPGERSIIITIPTKYTSHDRVQTIDATVYHSCRTARILLLTSPVSVKLDSMVAESTTFSGGGGTNVTVAIDRPTTVDTIVNLSYGGQLSGPATVTILAGNTTAIFAVSGTNNTGTPRNWTLKASLPNSSKSIVFRVDPPPG